MKKLFDLLTLNFWKEMPTGTIPQWVIRGAVKYYNKRTVRPYDKVIFLKGDHYIYRVWFEAVRQGEIQFHYYKKKRN